MADAIGLRIRNRHRRQAGHCAARLSASGFRVIVQKVRQAMIAEVAPMLPANIEEAKVAARAVSADAQASDCIRHTAPAVQLPRARYEVPCPRQPHDADRQRRAGAAAAPWDATSPRFRPSPLAHPTASAPGPSCPARRPRAGCRDAWQPPDTPPRPCPCRGGSGPCPSSRWSCCPTAGSCPG